MSTFKKLFASVAAVMVVASTVPANVFAASYSSEQQDAYDYAFGAGLTTQATIDGARLNDSITRAELAKVASVAAEAQGLSLDTSASCSFNDTASLQGSDLLSYVTKACQYGLMGVNTNGVFNPSGLVTRAELAAVIDRILNGDANVGGNPWYAGHMASLQDAGIMNDISNPMSLALRFHAFVMFQRADEEGTTPAVCQDPMVQLSCALGLDDCPAECSGDEDDNTDDEDDVVVRAGDLDVSLNSDTLANNSQIPQAGTVRFAAVDFEAGGEDVSLSSVTIAKVGLATVPSSTRVWFEKDGVRITGRAAFTSDGTAVLSFAPAFEVKENATETLDLYVELNASAGEDFKFESTDINSTAEDVNGGFDTPTLRTVSYTVSSAVFNDASVGGTASVTEDAQEIGAFSVQVTNPGSETRDSIFKSITLRQSDDADLSNLDEIVLERNGEVVSDDYIINGRDITFTVNNEIKDATTATYYIKAMINNVDQSTDDYTFELRNASDLNIVEKNTAFRLTVTGAQALQTYSIQGGDITFTRDTALPLSANYAAGTPNVVLMKGTIKTNTAITVEDPSIQYLGGLDDNAMYDQFSTIYLSIGGSTFSYSPVNASANTYANFLGTATINGSANVKVWGTLKDTAPATVIKLASLNLASFSNGVADLQGLAEYVSNGNTVTSAVGSIEGISVSVEDSTLNVTRTDGLGNQTVAGGSTAFSVLKLNMSSNQGNGVRVSRAVFATGATSALALNNVSLTLYVDGVAKATKQLQASSVTFDFSSFTVNSQNSHVVEVKADFAEAFNAGTFQLVLSSLNAVDVLTSQAVTYSTPSSAQFTIQTADAQVTASNSPVLASLFLSPSSAQKLFAFRVKALNDTVKLRDVTFTGAGLADLNNFKLTDAAGTVFATATTSSGTAVTFTNIAASSAPAIAKDATATFFLVADANSNVAAGTADVTLTALNIRGSNGSTVTPTFTAIASNSHAIAEDTMVVAKGTNGSKNLSTSALRFTVAASGKDSVTLNSIDLTTILAGYTGTANVEVYKSSVTTPNLVGSGNVNIGNDTISISPSANDTVDAGQTVTFIVVVTGLAVDPNSNSQDWSLTLTDLGFNGLNATDYDNVGGALPITESK